MRLYDRSKIEVKFSKFLYLKNSPAFYIFDSLIEKLNTVELWYNYENMLKAHNCENEIEDCSINFSRMLNDDLWNSFYKSIEG